MISSMNSKTRYANFVIPALSSRPFRFLSNRPSKRSVTCTIHRTVNMRQITGISEIARNYDIVLLDQFGVVHDGRTAYPGALNAINKLHETGVKIAILSNSSKRSNVAQKKMSKLGVDANAIHDIVTSGELTVGYVKDVMKSNPQARVLHFNWAEERGTVQLSDHDVTNVVSVSYANETGLNVIPRHIDFILAHGTDGITLQDGTVKVLPLEILRNLCRKVAEENPQAPFICANPDFVTVDGGTLRTMPGTLARDFEEHGGTVVKMGKPGNFAYDAALDACGEGRMLAIGDSIAHDILGAVERKIDCLFVAGGIHAECFRIDGTLGFKEERTDFECNEDVLARIVQEEAPELGQRRPTYVCDFLRW